ncbi:hypothetical protein O181_093956 [Austropuccinia psidii MF-1]|uniref:Uncharacterized protein n=1 Tax=Austropuccinia psidii MF-1 TaxID=1389203 RepID=A0A9Q3PBZ0_9BASI|nr:hypothetical protein [Austropuccinia psidii MF-1]
MVHTRNGSNYSVKPDGCGQGRGKAKSRSGNSSSIKTHLEDARVAPHLPRSEPTNFDVNSESELINNNISRVEPFASGKNRNLSIPIQELVQSSKREGVGNMAKPLTGGHELLLTHQDLSESGEYHRTLRRLDPIVFQRQGQKDEELVEKSKSFIHRPEGARKPKRPQKKQKDPKNHQGKGKGKANWHRPYPQGYRIPKLEPSAVDSVFNMARTLMEFTAKEQERMNRNFPHK